MVLDSCSIWLLQADNISVADENAQKTHLAILQTKICNSSHRCSFAFREVLVYLINAIRDMVVGFIEQITSANNSISEALNRMQYVLTVSS